MIQLEAFFAVAALVLVNVLQVNAFQCDSPKEVIAHIDSGFIRGTERLADGKVAYYSFRGVPYAEPPLGRLRFAPLQPVKPWCGVYDAIEDGPVCPQKDLYYGRLLAHPRGQREDCMYLSVHVTATVELSNGTDCNPKKLLPIVVMINEGGFQSGSGNGDFHGPEHLMRHNVMVVTANTRIGVFGFLSLNTPEIPGNNGIRDWITVLRWIQRNAKAFGGDPNNVTLLGSSTGAVMAHLIAASPAAVGLSHKLVLLSGLIIDSFYSLSPRYAKHLADEFRRSIPGASSDNCKFHEQLINMELGDIMKAFAEVQLTDVVSFGPVTESRHKNVETVVDQDGIKSLIDGRDTKYPIIFMETNNEMQFIKPLPIVQMMPLLLQYEPTLILSNGIKYNVSQDEACEYAKEIYSKCTKNNNCNLNCIVDILTEEYFHYPSRKYAQVKSRLGGAPVYMGRFSYNAEYSVIKSGAYVNASGSVHCEDLTYLFKSYLLGNHDSYPPKNCDDEMRDTMTNIIGNFVRCGNPTCTDDCKSQWPPITSDNLQYVIIDEPYKFKLTKFTKEDYYLIEYYDKFDHRINNALRQLDSVCDK